MSITTSASNSGPGRRGTILLVEDEPFLREATTRLLQSAGFTVLVAIDAEAALKLYERNLGQVDILMSDLLLPGRSGLQLRRDLRRSSPVLPILLTSGFLGGSDEELSDDKFTYFLPKPYSRTELTAKLDQILRTATLRDAAAG